MKTVTSASRAQEYQIKRDKEIEKKLEEAIAFLDKEEVKQALLQKILQKSQPKIDELKVIFEGILEEKTKSLTIEKIETLIKDNLEVFNKNLEEKVKEVVEEELDRRFSTLIKYHEEY